MEEPFIPDVTKWKYRRTIQQHPALKLFRRMKYEEPMLDGVAPLNYYARFVLKHVDVYDGEEIEYDHCIIVYNDAAMINERYKRPLPKWLRSGTLYMVYKWGGYAGWHPSPMMGIHIGQSARPFSTVRGDDVIHLINEWAERTNGEVISYAQYKQELANEPR